MKKLAVGVLTVGGITLGLVLLAGGGLFVYAESDYTVCYGIFKTGYAAQRAAEAGDEAGLDSTVDARRDDEVGRYWAVEFETGETGDDAREAREAFRKILRRERGGLGHPGNGCLERGPFDH